MRKTVSGWAHGITGHSLFLLAGLYFAVLPACASTNVIRRVLPFESGGTFSLENINGPVRVDGWNRNEVEIRAVKTSLNDPRDVARVQIHMQSDGERMSVRTVYPQGIGVEVTVAFEIHVPYRVLLNGVGTVNGDVIVSGITGEGDLHSVNGSVQVLDSEGRFYARTTNGDVRFELKRLPADGTMQLRTVNGSIVLVLPSGAGAELDVTNRNGDFRSDFPVRTLGAYDPRTFHGRIGAGGPRISLTTVNGEIRLTSEKAIV